MNTIRGGDRSVSFLFSQTRNNSRLPDKTLWAAAAVDDHAGQVSVDDVELVVKVEHRDGRHFARGAARAGRPRRIGLLHDVRVRILLQEDVRALAGTIVGLVLFRGDDPVPAELHKVHRQRVAAAARLGRRLVAIQADRPLRPVLPPVRRHYFHERNL